VWLDARDDGSRTQVWFDDPTSLAHKLSLVRTVGLRGAGMWHVDALNYSAAEGTAAFNDTQSMWQALRAAVTPVHEELHVRS
jgi:spore germination protein YaaH